MSWAAFGNLWVLKSLDLSGGIGREINANSPLTGVDLAKERSTGAHKLYESKVFSPYYRRR